MPGKTWLWQVGKKILTPYFFNYFSLRGEGEIPSPPFLLIANHLSALDPFFIDALLPYPVVWVANRLIFQHPVLGPLIRAMDAIPKRKVLPDYCAARNIIRVIEKGGVVGLFPEGGIPWNGVSQSVAPGTDKLLARIRVPVVFARIQGAWLRKPLWADHARYGPVSIRFTVLSDDPLAFFQHSEWEWQRKTWTPFLGERRAEGIERVVFFCPLCHAFRSIQGMGNRVICFSCGSQWFIDECGFIDGCTQRDFAKEQEKLLTSFCETRGRMVFSRALVTERTHPEGHLKRFFFSPIIVEEEGLRLHDELFPFSQIRGENTFLKKVLEFTVGKHLIRIHTEKDAFLLWSVIRLWKMLSSLSLEDVAAL